MFVDLKSVVGVDSARARLYDRHCPLGSVGVVSTCGLVKDWSLGPLVTVGEPANGFAVRHWGGCAAAVDIPG